jgi:ABC-type nitrate/sulfonate/bicarbonate transport system permease component
MIGQISLVNTYAHIHTPILISLRRTGYGIMIGTIVGLFALWVIRLIDKGLKKWVDVKR